MLGSSGQTHIPKYLCTNHIVYNRVHTSAISVGGAAISDLPKPTTGSLHFTPFFSTSFFCHVHPPPFLPFLQNRLCVFPGQALCRPVLSPMSSSATLLPQSHIRLTFNMVEQERALNYESHGPWFNSQSCCLLALRPWGANSTPEHLGFCHVPRPRPGIQEET